MKPILTTDGTSAIFSPGSAQAGIARCDRSLYDCLGSLVRDGGRSVQAVQDSNALPKTARYFAIPLSFAGTKCPIRPGIRAVWLRGAMHATKGTDIVFLDPDNGLEVKSTTALSIKGPKYVFLDDISPYLQRRQSLVVYQHLARNGS